MVNNITYNNKKTRGKHTSESTITISACSDFSGTPNEPKINDPYKKLKGFH